MSDLGREMPHRTSVGIPTFHARRTYSTPTTSRMECKRRAIRAHVSCSPFEYIASFVLEDRQIGTIKPSVSGIARADNDGVLDLSTWVPIRSVEARRLRILIEYFAGRSFRRVSHPNPHCAPRRFDDMRT
jgi:hypothetical protein